MEPGAGQENQDIMTTTDTTTTTSERHMAARTYQALTAREAAIVNSERSGASTLEQTRWSVFDSNVAAYRDLGDYLLKSIAPKISGEVNGTSIAHAFTDKTSGLYLTPEERKEAPTATRMSRALIIARVGSEQRLSEYRSARQTDDSGKVHENSAKVEDLAVWLGIVDSGKVGNRSTVDLSAMEVSGKGKTRKVGPLRRKATAAKTSSGPATATTVVGFFADLLSMSADDLRKVIADGPTDIDSIPEGKRRDLARQLMAAVVLAEQSEKVVVKI